MESSNGFFSDLAFSNASAPHSSQRILLVANSDKRIFSEATRHPLSNISLVLAQHDPNRGTRKAVALPKERDADRCIEASRVGEDNNFRQFNITRGLLGDQLF